jgi:uncharacterized protein YqjF (DUF2071 family)
MRPWVLRQRWLNLLFAHWPVPAAALRPFVPPSLTIEEFDGTSWVGIVPFKIEGLMWRGLPDLPYFSSFPEVNLRLYVTAPGKPGVWFISLDADNAAAVFGARTVFRLPYWRAQMSFETEGDAVHFRSVRRRAPQTCLDVRYHPIGPPAEAVPGTLDYFLTERYCLYTAATGGRLKRLDILHPPWQLQRATATFARNTLAGTQGVALPDTEPILHFSRRQDVIAWWPVVIDEHN